MESNNYNSTIYSPTYLSKEGILDTFYEEKELSPGSFLFFDSIEYKTINTFISYLSNYLNTINLIHDIDINIIYENIDKGDCIKIKSITGSILIRIPPRIDPMNIEREYLFITCKHKNRITLLNQPIQQLDQIILEARLIL